MPAMTLDLTLRTPKPDEYEAWHRLWDGYNTFYERTIPEEITRLTWDRFFDAYEPMHVIVAEAEGRLVGLVHFIYHRNTTMRGPVCYLQDLFADPDLRGKGIGRALIEAVYDHAREAGSDRVYWQTHETNATAMRLYDQVATHSGFVVYRKAL
tara:strand:+ start:643 stop:1101 length:459 start_codon:yes stop_codon:yes gene_type:complete